MWRQLPLKPGIYIFKNTAGEILYVGKAKSLRVRVRSYFVSSSKLGPKTAILVSQIAALDHIEVTSEVEALLLESRLIKKFRPPFNILSKDDKSPYYIHITKEPYPKPIITHQSAGSAAGPFLSAFLAKRLLKNFRRVAPYCIAPRPVKRPCFYSHLGVCDPCPGGITTPSQRLAYRKNISRLRRLLSGKFTTVAAELRRTMSDSAKKQDYEAAAEARDHLQALAYLLQLSIRPEEYLVNPNLASDLRHQAITGLAAALAAHLPPNSISQAPDRIEFFDIAHLRGDSATAAMTVAITGDLTSSQYRHFTIKTAQTDSDVDMMAEVLSRRLKRSDWPRPDLIVLDGGIPQLSILKDDVLKNTTWPPVIALAKREETIVIPTNSRPLLLRLPLDHPGLRLLVRLRDEAHRFSRRLHHKHRSQKLTA